MQLVGITNATPKFSFPWTVEPRDSARVDAKERRENGASTRDQLGGRVSGDIR